MRNPSVKRAPNSVAMHDGRDHSVSNSATIEGRNVCMRRGGFLESQVPVNPRFGVFVNNPNMTIFRETADCQSTPHRPRTIGDTQWQTSRENE